MILDTKVINFNQNHKNSGVLTCNESRKGKYFCIEKIAYLLFFYNLYVDKKGRSLQIMHSDYKYVK